MVAGSVPSPYGERLSCASAEVRIVVVAKCQRILLAKYTFMMMMFWRELQTILSDEHP